MFFMRFHKQYVVLGTKDKKRYVDELEVLFDRKDNYAELDKRLGGEKKNE